jgi:hypothetical protein
MDMWVAGITIFLEDCMTTHVIEALNAVLRRA